MVLRPPDGKLALHALSLVEANTTELADASLRVPASFYRDGAQLGRELELLRSTPIAVAPSCQIGQPHDYVVRDVLGASLLVTRDGDGAAHVLSNVCRHRGAPPASGCGNARRFACPYHAWTYDSAGKLVGIPGAEGFADIDRDAHGLTPLPCEERNGFVWTVLNGDGPLDVAAHLGPLDAELAHWRFESNQYLTEREIEAGFNWKTGMEAFAENYHFPYVHAKSLLGGGVVPNTATFDAFGPHGRLGFPCPWIDGARGLAADDIDPLHFMVFIYWVFPNLTLAVSPVGTEIIDILPAGGTGRTLIRHGWMATVPAADEKARAGYEQLYEAVHAAVRDEDIAVLSGCGAGLADRHTDHVVLGRNEIGVQHVARTLAAATGFPLP